MAEAARRSADRIPPISAGCISATAQDEPYTEIGAGKHAVDEHAEHRLQRRPAELRPARPAQLAVTTTDERMYGKEILGDLYEGKRTLPLMHLLSVAQSGDLERDHVQAVE